jgi:hypothetical protein
MLPTTTSTPTVAELTIPAITTTHTIINYIRRNTD